MPAEDKGPEDRGRGKPDRSVIAPISTPYFGGEVSDWSSMTSVGTSQLWYQRRGGTSYATASTAMTDEPVDLDARRSTESKMATDIRRHSLRDFEADQEALRRRQAELEVQLLAEPAITWHEAAIKAQYLVRRYAETSDAQDARRQKLIERALGDIARLIEGESTDR